jgi:hypothetical protein
VLPAGAPPALLWSAIASAAGEATSQAGLGAHAQHSKKAGAGGSGGAGGQASAAQQQGARVTAWLSDIAAAGEQHGGLAGASDALASAVASVATAAAAGPQAMLHRSLGSLVAACRWLALSPQWRALAPPPAAVVGAADALFALTDGIAMSVTVSARAPGAAAAPDALSAALSSFVGGGEDFARTLQRARQTDAVSPTGGVRVTLHGAVLDELEAALAIAAPSGPAAQALSQRLRQLRRLRAPAPVPAEYAGGPAAPALASTGAAHAPVAERVALAPEHAALVRAWLRHRATVEGQLAALPAPQQQPQQQQHQAAPLPAVSSREGDVSMVSSSSSSSSSPSQQQPAGGIVLSSGGILRARLDALLPSAPPAPATGPVADPAATLTPAVAAMLLGPFVRGGGLGIGPNALRRQAYFVSSRSNNDAAVRLFPVPVSLPMPADDDTEVSSATGGSAPGSDSFTSTSGNRINSGSFNCLIPHPRPPAIDLAQLYAGLAEPQDESATTKTVAPSFIRLLSLLDPYSSARDSLVAAVAGPTVAEDAGGAMPTLASALVARALEAQLSAPAIGPRTSPYAVSLLLQGSPLVQDALRDLRDAAQQPGQPHLPPPSTADLGEAVLQQSRPRDLARWLPLLSAAVQLPNVEALYASLRIDAAGEDDTLRPSRYFAAPRHKRVTGHALVPAGSAAAAGAPPMRLSPWLSVTPIIVPDHAESDIAGAAAAAAPVSPRHVFSRFSALRASVFGLLRAATPPDAARAALPLPAVHSFGVKIGRFVDTLLLSSRLPPQAHSSTAQAITFQARAQGLDSALAALAQPAAAAEPAETAAAAAGGTSGGKARAREAMKLMPVPRLELRADGTLGYADGSDALTGAAAEDTMPRLTLQQAQRLELLALSPNRFVSGLELLARQRVRQRSPPAPGKRFD